MYIYAPDSFFACNLNEYDMMYYQGKMYIYAPDSFLECNMDEYDITRGHVHLRAR